MGLEKCQWSRKGVNGSRTGVNGSREASIGLGKVSMSTK